MGWLEYLLGQSSPAGLPPQYPDEFPGLKRKGGIGADYVASRNPPPMRGADPADINAELPGPELMPPTTGMGMLSQTFGAKDVQPSTNDPLSREPVPYVNGAPFSGLPSPKPAETSSPMSMAPPDPTALPPNATSTVGQVPPVNQSPPDAPASGGGILGKIFNPANAPMLLAMGGGFAGAPSFGTGMRRGFSAAAPQAALLRKEQLGLENQSATVKALVAKGVPPDIAMAAATNPELMKQLVPQMFGAKQLQHVTIKDRLGNEIPLTFDPSSGKYRTPTGEPYGAPNASGTSGMGDPTKTGPEYLETLDPMTRNEVKAFGEGRAPVTARNLQQMLPLVTQAYPGFRADQYPVMLATRKSYTSGKDFQETQALNTVSGHFAKLADAVDGLDNGPIPLWNKLKNMGRDAFTGSPELARFRNDLVTTANELAKAYHGGHVTDAAYAAFNKALNEAQTKTDMKAALGEISGLLKSKIEAKESGYRSSMGDAPLPSEFRSINDEARHAFEKIDTWSKGIKPEVKTTTSPTAPMAPGNYIFDPATGQMVKQ